MFILHLIETDIQLLHFFYRYNLFEKKKLKSEKPFISTIFAKSYYLVRDYKHMKIAQ